MKKKYYFIIIPVILTVVYFLSSLYFSKYESMKISTPSMDKGVDYKNATYKIDGKSVVGFVMAYPTSKGEPIKLSASENNQNPF